VREADGLAGRPHDREQLAFVKAARAQTSEDDELLPLGLDSHRYRCCGNGVVAPVAEWLGERIAAAITAKAA
jgi:site-specific DNA-cytosine methylase